ncbi:hypothetical protein ACIQVO_38025 [Streptomyces sp. NPDC101062]|uniref:wHTH domain-containing protein n=1 Tax=unclassified Streptomyces TaxID=2593676 RepID=UPI002E768DEC|nr:hypothetical protein [Streptomyces sp. JV176]MEE1798183.1 hypothetical protein [Streptomyces sp. JV176]
MRYRYEPAFEDPDDNRITSLRAAGESPWWEADSKVPYGHVLYAAAGVGWSADAVVERLTALGFTDIERPEGPLPRTVDREDALLANAGGRTDHHLVWIGVGTPVTLRHIVDAAGRVGRGPADVERTLISFGYQVSGTGPRPLPETPDPRDILLIRKGSGGEGAWLERGDEVPPRHVIAAAHELRCSPHTAAKRLAELGCRLPYTPQPEDKRIIGDGRVTVGHILDIAQQLDRTPSDIVARLVELGHRVPSGVPDTPKGDDYVMLSERLDGMSPWLATNDVVGVQPRHVLRAALATGRSPADIAARLAEMGHWMPGHVRLPQIADEADVRLLAALDPDRSLLDDVLLENVLRCASLTGRTPADVAARLREFGYRLPEEVAYPEIRGSAAA